MEPARDPEFISLKKRKRRCSEEAGCFKRFLKMSDSEISHYFEAVRPCQY